MSEQQRDWRQVKIGELLTEHSEGSVSSNQHEVLSVTKDGIFSQREYFKKQIASEDNSGYKIVRRGDVVFSAMNLWMGSIDVVKDQVIGIVSPAYITMRPTEGLIDTGFLGYFLRGDEMRKKYVQHSQQGASIVRRNLNKDDLLDDEVLLPPLPEQKKIAEILSGIDRQIGLISRAIDSNRAARNALMESIFHEGHRKATNRSDEWRIWTVEELLANSATPMRSGPFGSALLKEELADEGIPFLGIDNVKTEEFVPTFKRFLPPQKFQQLSRYEVFPHDVMITIMGTVGRSCVVPAGIGPCVSSKHTWTMTFDRHKVAPEIVCWQLNHFSRTRKRFSEGSQGGVMDAISSQTLRETEVPFPTAQDLAERILGYYKISLRHEKEMRARLEKTRLLKSAVSSDLLSGRKRVSV